MSRLEPVDSKGYTDDMRRAIGAVPGARTYVTGQAAIEHDLDPVFARDLLKGELIAVPIALLILVFTFGTLAFLIPFAFALYFALQGGEYGTTHLLQLRREEAEERAMVAQLRRIVDSLQVAARAIEGDPRVQERVARESFGMIRRGEFLYRIVPPDSAP